MQKIADSETFATPPTIDDPAILAEIETALKRVGYARAVPAASSTTPERG